MISAQMSVKLVTEILIIVPLVRIQELVVHVHVKMGIMIQINQNV